MNREDTIGRALMTADAVGCGVAGLVVLTPAGAVVTTRRSARATLGGLLLLSAACLGQGVRRPRLNRVDYLLGVVLNACWVTGCLVSVARQPGRPGRRLLVLTAALDAIAGTGQLMLATRRRGGG